MKEITKKSGDISISICMNKYIRIKNRKYSPPVLAEITPTTATLMIQALQEYLDGLSQPKDYEHKNDE